MQTSLEIEKQICQVHKLEIVAVDLKLQTRIDDKYLCTRCLAERVDKENMVLLNEATEMIQSMKTQSVKLAKEEDVRRLTNLKQLQSSLKSFKDYVKVELEKLLQLIFQQMEYIQLEIESKESKLEAKNYDEEIQILSKFYIGNCNFNIPKQQPYKEMDLTLVQLIQESIESQSKSQHFLKIMESIDLIRSSVPIDQQANINKIPTKEFDQHKTPCLNQICNKHNKEIIMVNVNQNKPKLGRLACVECIEENPIQYISLKEANKMWNTFIRQSEDFISNHNFKREKKFKMVIEEIKQLKDYYTHSLSEMLSTINEQLIENNQEFQDFLKLENKQIFEQDQQQVENIIDLLSQYDKNKYILQQQKKQDRLDELFYYNVKSQLKNLFKHDLLCKQQLMTILEEKKGNLIFINLDYKDIENNVQTDMKINPEIQEFISHSQFQEQYLQKFPQSVDQQIELQDVAQQDESKGLLEQFIEGESEAEDLKYSFVQQENKIFEIDSYKLWKLIQAEKQLSLIRYKNQLSLKIGEEKQDIKKIIQKIVDLEENMNQKLLRQEQEFSQQFNNEIIQNNQIISQSNEIRFKELTSKQNELKKKIEETQSDLQEREKCSIVQDKLESLKTSILIIFDENVEKLTEAIRQVDTQQSTQSLQQTEVLMQKINDEITTKNSSIIKLNLNLEQFIQKYDQQLAQLSLKEENMAEIKELENLNPQQIQYLEDKISQQINQLQIINAEVQDNTKNIKKHEELLKCRFLQCRYDLLDQQTTNYFLKQLFLEQKLDQILKPNLLRNDYWIKIYYILQERTKKNIKQSVLIYQGTRDGLNNQQYWNKVNGKGNLLMVFKSNSDYIFGAYSPCKWESCGGKYVEDTTMSSFIFSQTHDSIHPLKSDYKQYAIISNSNYGPMFGIGSDIYISGDFTNGHSKLGRAYQFDEYKKGIDDPYLFGQSKPEIKECEIYELQFV